MTMLNGSSGVSVAAHNIARAIAAAFAVLLAGQCVWLLLPEVTRPHLDQLPLDRTFAASAANYGAAAERAASFGVIRGDLWAQSAFTHANLLWSDATDTNSSTMQSVGSTRTSLDRALTHSPHQSGAWLFLADLALHYQLALDPSEPLKMSYYTGASDQHLMPLRLRVSAQMAKFNDVEIRQFVERDLRFFLTHKQTGEIADAYGVASPAAKSLIEQTVQDIDPTALEKIRAATPRKQDMPE